MGRDAKTCRCGCEYVCFANQGNQASLFYKTGRQRATRGEVEFSGALVHVHLYTLLNSPSCHLLSGSPISIPTVADDLKECISWLFADQVRDWDISNPPHSRGSRLEAHVGYIYINGGAALVKRVIYTPPSSSLQSGINLAGYFLCCAGWSAGPFEEEDDEVVRKKEDDKGLGL